MNKDLSLKSNKDKLIFLIVGNNGVGKKSIAKKWTNKYKIKSEDNRTFFHSINLEYEDYVEDEILKIPMEIRILNSEEMETALKNNWSFFKGSMGAFVVTSISDFMSFQE
jgi:ABC-type branched-subunit amino acid transport system ATPase component